MHGSMQRAVSHAWNIKIKAPAFYRQLLESCLWYVQGGFWINLLIFILGKHLVQELCLLVHLCWGARPHRSVFPLSEESPMLLAGGCTFERIWYSKKKKKDWIPWWAVNVLKPETLFSSFSLVNQWDTPQGYWVKEIQYGEKKRLCSELGGGFIGLMGLCVKGQDMHAFLRVWGCFFPA